jgi:hypothetical protein
MADFFGARGGVNGATRVDLSQPVRSMHKWAREETG